jgi:hypothetical protein
MIDLPGGDGPLRCEASVSIDHEHQSLPRLYGAPPHRIRRMAAVASEPALGPDDLPMEHYRSPEDQALATELLARSYSRPASDAGTRPPQVIDVQGDDPHLLRGAPLLLRSIAGRLMRPTGH